MDGLGDIWTYAWQRLPLVLLFGGGYLVYQLMAATRITDAFVTWALNKSRGNCAAMMLYVIGTAAVLSSFIPNTITVLTLLPVLKRLDDGFRRQGVDDMTTVLMCSAIYGAAIGGIGSMIGTPANAVLFAALDLFQVTGRESITFFNWFLWSVPLVVMLMLAAWGVVVVGLPSGARDVRIAMDCLDGACEITARQRYGGRMFWLYMGFWITEAVLRQVVPGFAAVSPFICLGFTGLFLYLIFVRHAPRSSFGEGPLLRFGTLFTGLPRRGLVFLGALVVIFAVVHWLKLDEWAVRQAGELLKGDMPGSQLFLLTVLAVIFLTEVLSNTAVVAAFFTIAYYAAVGHGMNPLYLMMGVSIGSVCAFMTPIATPTNALAFGEMKGASLTKMLGMGFALNLLGAVLVTVWLTWVLPLVY